MQHSVPEPGTSSANDTGGNPVAERHTDRYHAHAVRVRYSRVAL